MLGFRVAYWDDQGLWPNIAQFLLPNLPLPPISVHLPQSLLVATRSAPVPGSTTLKDIVLHRVPITCRPSSSSDILLRQNLPQSPDHNTTPVNAADSPERQTSPITELTSAHDSLTYWLESGPDICASTAHNGDYPLLNLYVFTCDSFEIYKANLRTQIRRWAERMGEAGEEMLILFVTPQEGEAIRETSKIKAHRKLFEKIRTDLITAIESSFATTAPPSALNTGRIGRVRSMKERVFRIPIFTLPVEGFEATGRESEWRGLPRRDQTFVELWEMALRKFAECVSASISARIAAEQAYKESQQTSSQRTARAKYTTVFDATERLAGTLFRCGLYPEALNVYDSLDLRMADSHTTAKRYRTLFHSCGLPPLGSEPVVFDIDRRNYRRLIQNDSISYVEFRQYLFARQAQVIYRTGRLDKICGRAMSFMTSFSMDLLSFTSTSTGNESSQRLREASVRCFSLALAHNLLVRLIELGRIGGLNESDTLGPVAIPESSVLPVVREESEFDSNANLSARPNVRFNKNLDPPRPDTANTSTLRERITLSAAFVTSQLLLIEIYQLWWLIWWREEEEWRELSQLTPPESAVNWREILSNPIETKTQRLLLWNVDMALQAEAALIQWAEELLSKNSFERQRIALQVLHTRFMARLEAKKIVHRSIDPMPRMTETEALRELCRIGKEGRVSILTVRLAEIIARIDAVIHPSLTLMLSWLLCHREVTAYIRTTALSMIQNIAPLEDISSLTEIEPMVLLKIMVDRTAGALPASMMQAISSFRRREMASSQLSSFETETPDVTRFLTRMPAAPNLFVWLDILNNKSEAVLNCSPMDRRGPTSSPNTLNSSAPLLTLTPVDDWEAVLISAGGQMGARFPQIAAPPIPIRGGDRNFRDSVASIRSKSSIEDAQSTLRRRESSSPRLVHTPRKVPFGEPLTMRLLIQSNMGVDFAAHQIWLRLLVNPSAGDRSRFEKFTSMSSQTGESSSHRSGSRHPGIEPSMLWIRLSSPAEYFHIGKNSFSHLDFSYFPTIPGCSLQLLDVMVLPSARTPFYFVVKANLAHYRTSQAETCLKALSGSRKQCFEQTHSRSCIRTLDVQNNKHAFDIDIKVIDPDGSVAADPRMWFGRLNYVKVSIRTRSYARLHSEGKMAIQARWIGNRGGSSLLNHYKANILHAHIIAVEIDGRTEPDGKGGGIVATQRCIPNQHDGGILWLSLPKFEKTISIIVPVEVFAPHDYPSLQGPGTEHSNMPFNDPDTLPEPSPRLIDRRASASTHQYRYANLSSLRPLRQGSASPEIIATVTAAADAASGKHSDTERSQASNYFAKARSGSLTRLSTYRLGSTLTPVPRPKAKEATVLVPRHVRSPSVRLALERPHQDSTYDDFNLAGGDLSPPIMEHAVQQLSQFVQVTIRLRCGAHTCAKDAETTDDEGEMCKGLGNGPLSKPLHRPKVEICQDASPPFQASPRLPRLTEISSDGPFVADQSHTEVMGVDTLFGCHADICVNGMDKHLYATTLTLLETIGGPRGTDTPTVLVETPSRLQEPNGSNLPGSLETTQKSSVSVQAALDQFEVLLVGVAVTGIQLENCYVSLASPWGHVEGVGGSNVKLEIIPTPLHAGQSFGTVVQVTFNDMACLAELDFAAWQVRAKSKLVLQWAYQLRDREHADNPGRRVYKMMDAFVAERASRSTWISRHVVECKWRPSPLIISNLTVPRMAEKGSVVRVVLTCRNLTQFRGYLRYNALLSFDTEIDELREIASPLAGAESFDANGEIVAVSASSKCWQLVGSKCRTVTVEAGSDEDIEICLIPVTAGLLQLPTIKLNGFLEDPAISVRVAATVTGFERPLVHQPILVTASGPQRLPIRLLRPIPAATD